MASPIGRLTAVLGIDAREFTTGLDTAQKKANSFGITTSSVMKATGVAVAGGFAFMAKGALEAQKAQGEFMAATGKSREQAKLFVSGMDSLAGSAGAVGMSFEDIAKTGTMVEQQFGTTGKATTDLTENILEFSKVTGQDAAGAAADLEDTLSTFGMSADDATGFMDSLIASNQKFGTEVGPETLDTLRNMSASLQAVGGDITDGVGFLNLFESAGLDASAASTGLTKAIKGLKPGQDLDSLIAQVGSIEDPLARAQKAAELFGTKAGPKLALAIQPGMTSLDDFKVAADGAGDHLHDAAGNLLTDADKIQGIFDKLGAGARELGQQFGPALAGLGGIASLATGFSGTIKSALGAVANTAPVKAAGAAIGAVVGEAMSLAQSAAATGSAAIGRLVAGIGAMSVPLAAEGTTVGTAIGGAIGAAIPLAMAGGFAALGVGALEIGPILDHLFGQDTTSKLANAGKYAAQTYAGSYSTEVQDKFAAIVQDTFDKGGQTQASANAGVSAGKAYLASLSNGLADEMGSHATWDPISATMVTASTEVGTTAGTALVNSYNQSAEANANKNSMVMYDIMTANHDAQTKAAEDIWNASAHAITGDLVGSLKSAKDDIGNAMDDLLWAINHPMAMEKDVLKIQAELNSKTMAEGLASSNTEIHDTAVQSQQKLLDLWKSLDPKGYELAHQASVSISDGLSSEYPASIADARQFVKDFNAQLSQIKTDLHVNVNTAGNRFGNVGLRATGGPVQAGGMYRINENTVHSEWFSPDVNGTVLRDDQVSPGGNTFTFHIYDATDPQKVGEVVADKIQRVLRLSNSLPLDRSGVPD